MDSRYRPQRPEVLFPRRLLFIHVSHYAFLNSLTPHAPGEADQTKVAALRLAQELKVNVQGGSQLAFFSDSAPLPDTKLATRDAIMEAYEHFFASSGSGERIVIYFGGHAIEAEGKAYLVPMEGNVNQPRGLIPLDDFYAKLKACRAIQKVVIWDVCRFNPDRGRKHPGSEPLSSSLARALSSAPPGIEVVITCQPGENALEFDALALPSLSTHGHYSGSLFLESIPPRAEFNRVTTLAQTPADRIPMAEWLSGIAREVAELSGSEPVRRKQTITYHPGKPLPPVEPKTSVTTTAPLSAPVLSPEVQAMVNEFRVPPIPGHPVPMSWEEGQFRSDLIERYASPVPLDEIRKNKQKYPLQHSVLAAIQTVRDIGLAGGKGLPRRELIALPVTEALKKEIKKELDAWASGIAKLEEIDRSFDQLAAHKKEVSPRWQAHFDYARAVVKSRLAYMNEYDKLMADVLSGVLPPVEEKRGQNAYRLVASEKMRSKKDVQQYAADAVQLFDTIIVEHKQTPWASQAQSDCSALLGLVWQPETLKK